MASAMAAACMLLRPPPCTASASPLPMNPFFCRLPRSLTTIAPATLRHRSRQSLPLLQPVFASPSDVDWTSVPVSAIAPATKDNSMFLITLDLSRAPDLEAMYTTPGQHLMARVPLPGGLSLHPAPMCISSAPNSGNNSFDLLVKSLPGTTSEQLCKLHAKDVVEIGPVIGPGFAIQNINPPEAAETMLLFAAAEGISPIRALIESGFSANERADVRLYYAARDFESMPYQEKFEQWKETGVTVIPLTLRAHNIQELSLEHTLNGGNPLSMGAVIVGPLILKKVITKVLLDHGVPQEKILTIGFNPDIKQSNRDLWP